MRQIRDQQQQKLAEMAQVGTGSLDMAALARQVAMAADTHRLVKFMQEARIQETNYVLTSDQKHLMLQQEEFQGLIALAEEMKSRFQNQAATPAASATNPQPSRPRPNRPRPPKAMRSRPMCAVRGRSVPCRGSRRASGRPGPNRREPRRGRLARHRGRRRGAGRRGGTQRRAERHRAGERQPDRRDHRGGPNV